ncbi:MAG: ATP-binding cassette domain-containing protein [Planctomycetes bacterium]|nr:ATP-binding cassette domain-containing protein [Planctomycetota bacterium]
MNPPATPAMISAHRLSKEFTVHKKEPGLRGSLRALFRRRYIVKEAVKAASFEVNEGELVGLVGANGAGKTTLVKMLAGVIHPTSGAASVLGYCPWERDNRLRRKMALIMGQKASLWWDLPAADCFLLLREIYQIPRPRFEATIEMLTEMLEVREQLKIQIRRLSLGERMKMELVAALLHEPRVVFLDEPTIGLDLTAQRAIREFLLRYLREHRPAMLLTSHYMEDIEKLCERIIILREGEIVYDGPLARVVATYAPYKVVTAHLDGAQGAWSAESAAAALGGLGEVAEAAPGVVRLHVPRAEVARSAAAVLRELPVVDVTIEEPEIGAIIERIMRERGGAER